ncbi:hypothetical protein [Streptomyces sp. NBC_01012]|uniref:hypothetical protein n=1 Tax=Streptomyces sp. NBC_01012 TaxID=2903717 RepID=UPI0038652823|nr:hypothetical protein OG623_16220 [Streptomyces sp. NBC_01012]
MFGKNKRTAATTTAIPTAQPSDQYRLKATGQRVTLLDDFGDGAVRVAMDSNNVLREGIIRARDITPA